MRCQKGFASFLDRSPECTVANEYAPASVLMAEKRKFLDFGFEVGCVPMEEIKVAAQICLGCVLGE